MPENFYGATPTSGHLSTNMTIYNVTYCTVWLTPTGLPNCLKIDFRGENLREPTAPRPLSNCLKIDFR